MITRRDLFRRLAGAVIGVSVAPVVAKAALADYATTVEFQAPPPVCDFTEMFKVGDIFTSDGAQFRVTSVSVAEVNAIPVLAPPARRKGKKLR